MRKLGKGLFSFSLGALTMLILVLLVMPALAADGIEVTIFPGVNIFINGQKLDAKDANGNHVDAFIYNDSTYLPVRAVSEALGVAVHWEGSTKSVYLGERGGEAPKGWPLEAEYNRMKDKLNNDWASIDLFYDYGTERGSIGGPYYQLRNHKTYCTLYYNNWETGEEINVNFDEETYQRFVDLVLTYYTEPYVYPTTEYGKIEYETLPRALHFFLSSAPGEQILCQEPANMDEIVAQFELLKLHAVE